MEEQKRLIITDDDEDDRYFLESLFKEANQNLEITSVAGSDQLFNLLEAEHSLPSVLILDLNMPLIDGFQVLKRLKSSDQYRTIPVIVITTSDVEADIQEAYRLGANAFVTKPDLYTDFQKTISVLSQFWLNTAKLP